MNAPRVVVIGAGAAGTAAANELRRLGLDGDLTLVHGEGAAPYNRTAVFKTLLQPDAQFDSVRTTIPADDKTTLVRARARGVDTDARIVHLDDDTYLAYDALVIATGARPRTLRSGVIGAEGIRVEDKVTPLRTLADAERIRIHLASIETASHRPARVGIAGGSLLGSETADVLHGLGHEVHLIDPSTHPLQRLVGLPIATWVRDQHQANLTGVHEATVNHLEVAERNLAARLSNGVTLIVDLLIEALGVTPDVEWLSGAGLDLRDGVVVDDRLRVKGLSGAYAAGDLAAVEGTRRVEHWGHALAQGAHAARTLTHELGLTEDPGPFRPSGSYSTWLYGKPISVLGTPASSDREIVLATLAEHGAHAAVHATAEDQVSAARVLGSAKLANKLRPLVAAGAPVEEAAVTVAANLRSASIVG